MRRMGGGLGQTAARVRAITVAALAALAVVAVPGAAQAAPDASISGTVTAEGGGALELIVVHAYDAATHAEVGSTMTDENGAYAIGGLEPGSYVLWFEDTPHTFTHASEWYDGAYRMEDATPVVLAEAEVRTGVDVELELAARICGGVFDPFDQAAVGASIYAERVDGLAAGADVTAMGWTCVENLPSGDWRIQVGGEGYVTQWYDGAATRDGAAVVSLAPGQQLDMAIVLEWTSGIAGTVTDAQGQPVATEVTATDVDDATRVRTTTTAADGAYSLSLPAGSWTVAFTPQDAAYQPQWFAGASTAADADAVVVTAGAVTPGIDATLVGPPLVDEPGPRGPLFCALNQWLLDHGYVTGLPECTFAPPGAAHGPKGAGARSSAAVPEGALNAFLGRAARSSFADAAPRGLLTAKVCSLDAGA